MLCGHDAKAVVSSKEGTNYCGTCVDEERLKQIRECLDNAYDGYWLRELLLDFQWVMEYIERLNVSQSKNI